MAQFTLEGSTNYCKQCQKVTVVTLKDNYCCIECGAPVIISPQEFFGALDDIFDTTFGILKDEPDYSDALRKGLEERHNRLWGDIQDEQIEGEQ